MDVRNGCFAADCGNQKSQNIDSANKCQISKKVKEEVDGCESLYIFVFFMGSILIHAESRVHQPPGHGRYGDEELERRKHLRRCTGG